MLFVGKPEGKRPLGRPRHRWVNSIKMDLVEIVWNCVDWIGISEDRDKWEMSIGYTSCDLAVLSSIEVVS
jgi:hypothetical protein